MFKRKSTILLALIVALSLIFSLTGCNSEPAPKKEQEKQEEQGEKPNDAEKKPEEVGGGFEEFPIGDDQEVGPLVVAGVYFQPVDIEPARNSLSKTESDCHTH